MHWSASGIAEREGGEGCGMGAHVSVGSPHDGILGVSFAGYRQKRQNAFRLYFAEICFQTEAGRLFSLWDTKKPSVLMCSLSDMASVRQLGREASHSRSETGVLREDIP